MKKIFVFLSLILFGNLCCDNSTESKPGSLVLSLESTHVNNYEGSDGSIDLTVTGGTKPYQYQWSNGASTEDVNNLIAGSYSVTVTDAEAQTKTDSTFIQAQELFIRHNIDLNFTGACSICSYDLDGDGDLDILAANNLGRQVAWWRNEGGNSTNFTKFLIGTNSYGMMFVDAGDIDNDGDLDVFGASWNGNMIVVWINSGSNPMNWENDTLDTNIGNAHEVHAADINKDGLLDIIAAGGVDNVIAWYQNNGNDVNTWNKNIVANQFAGARSVVSDDINMDSYPDLIGAALDANQICVWLNDGGNPIGWDKQIVDNNFGGAHWVHACDLDRDGDIDILGAAAIANQIAWWRNNGGNPIQWDKQTISNNFDGALSVAAGDLDGDNDLDIFGAAINANRVSWWRNDGGTPIQWSSNTIVNNYSGAWPVFGVDFDEDGDFDILTAASTSHNIDWWENTVVN